MRTDRGKATAIGLGLALSVVALGACDSGSQSPSDGSGATVAPAPTAGGTVSSSGPAASPSAGTGSAQGSQPLKGKVVVLDPGHNGRNAEHPEEINRQVSVGNGRKACDTTGTATNAGYNEHAFTWDVSKRLEKLLQAQGATVVLTRKNDKGVGPCITERAAIGNDADADAAVSIHADGAPPSGHGFHIIRPLPVSGFNTGIVDDSKELGLALRKTYRAGTGISYSTYRGEDAIDARDDLGGLNLSKVPKVFIECGNMRNPAEAAKLSNPAFRQRIADSLAEGIENYLR